MVVAVTVAVAVVVAVAVTVGAVVAVAVRVEAAMIFVHGHTKMWLNSRVLAWVVSVSSARRAGFANVSRSGTAWRPVCRSLGHVKKHPRWRSMCSWRHRSGVGAL